jgi:hypothetical protein
MRRSAYPGAPSEGDERDDGLGGTFTKMFYATLSQIGEHNWILLHEWFGFPCRRLKDGPSICERLAGWQRATSMQVPKIWLTSLIKGFHRSVDDNTGTLSIDGISGVG